MNCRFPALYQEDKRLMDLGRYGNTHKANFFSRPFDVFERQQFSGNQQSRKVAEAAGDPLCAAVPTAPEALRRLVLPWEAQPRWVQQLKVRNAGL